MGAVSVKRRPPTGARRVGYAVAGAINIVLLYLINGRPGWGAVPFLTEDTTRVLALVNVSLAAGVAANLVQLVRDPPWLVALAGMLTTAIGCAALIRLWQVFPLQFGDATFDWSLLARLLLAMGVAGSIIGFLAQAAAMIGAVSRGPGTLHGSPRS